MNRGVYSAQDGKTRRSRRRVVNRVLILTLVLVVIAAGYVFLRPNSVEQTASQINFDESVLESERAKVRAALQVQQKTLPGSVSARAVMGLEANSAQPMLAAYVPVTGFYAARQSIGLSELSDVSLYVPEDMDDMIRQALAGVLNVDVAKLNRLTGDVSSVSPNQVVFIPADQLIPTVKLLGFNGSYFLDDNTKGAVFRSLNLSGESAGTLHDLTLTDLPDKASVLKINMTGVTALTRVMMRKLAAVKDPLHFSQKIGDFLAEADITHVSNEVSFRAGCQYHVALFCSPPEFIETLKASGVDLVELTGNHNNDNGSSYNTDSIHMYHSLGMATFGGGLDAEEAARAHVVNQKGSSVAFFGYNMADGLGSGAIAGESTAGANYYTEEKAKSDIATAKQNGQFVIVSIQYAECQAYPAGYVEYPQCDGPIGGQVAAFRKMIDLGADLVMGSSAHQPQTYELYEGKPIYYGLGNMYFDQTQWPGTERGIILTHYVLNGKLLQTKLSPTVYDREFQTALMAEEDAEILLDRLVRARP